MKSSGRNTATQGDGYCVPCSGILPAGCLCANSYCVISFLPARRLTPAAEEIMYVENTQLWVAGSIGTEELAVKFVLRST